jgi:hypothetical protein
MTQLSCSIWIAVTFKPPFADAQLEQDFKLRHYLNFKHIASLTAARYVCLLKDRR